MPYRTYRTLISSVIISSHFRRHEFEGGGGDCLSSIRGLDYDRNTIIMVVTMLSEGEINLFRLTDGSEKFHKRMNAGIYACFFTCQVLG